ncbi:MAG: glutathione S-transferase family protein, partial [Myxococcota bacterium]
MLSNTFILHHYDLSPYAEKVRLLLGMANAAWGSVLTPAMPPRPSVEPLAGGYRRIPIAQMGADLFCDSRLIAAELAQWTGLPHLSPQATPESAAALVRRAEGDVFFAAAGAAPTHVLLGTVLRNFGLLGSLRFAFDRIHMVRSAASPPPQGRAAMRMYQQFQADLNGVLAQHPILSGDTPGYADVALYHVVWLNTQARRAPLTDDHPHLKRWFERIASLGH